MPRHQPCRLALALLFAAVWLPAAGWAGQARTRFVLESGTVIQGDVVASDPKALTIQSSSLGRIRVSRDSIRQVQESVSELDIRTRERMAGEPGELFEQVLSIRVVAPLPAKIAE